MILPFFPKGYLLVAMGRSLRSLSEDHGYSASTGPLDLRRLGDMLLRIKGRIIHKELDRVSPLAVPVMLEIGREQVYGEASDELLAEAADELVKEAMS
jgi:ATP-dependent Lhr-like helicase